MWRVVQRQPHIESMVSYFPLDPNPQALQWNGCRRTPSFSAQAKQHDKGSTRSDLYCEK